MAAAAGLAHGWNPSVAMASRKPCVLVTASEGADAVAGKSGCSFAALPAHFGLDTVEGLDANIKTVHEQHTHVLTSLRLRFVSSPDLATPDKDAAEAEMQAVVTAAGEDPNMGLACPKVKDKQEAREFQERGMEPAPWVEDYRRVFQHTLRCSDHEFFDQPVIHLLVLSSAEAEAATLGDAFRGLQQRTPQPRIIAQNIYDGDVPLYYLVLHDNSTSRTRAAELEKALQGLYGPGASRLLQINSGDAQLGWFNEQDGTSVRGFMHEFAFRSVVPCMERKIRSLYATIVEQRKGFGNSLKSWFGGAQKAERVGVTIYAGNTPPAYTSVALESQIRLFADLCFMLQDYDMALKHYRMVRDDYKNDGANKAQAGAMEMIGVCMLLLGGSAREIETSLENSIVIYQRERCTALATRATLLLYDCYKLWRRDQEASMKLLRASDHESDNDCRAAIMLELGGYCFLQISPPQFRKYAFHLVLAGFRYNLAHQRKHTVRCYSTALYAFEQNSWSHVEDHLNFALGRQTKQLADYPTSMQYLMMLLRECQQPAERQEFFVKEFVDVASRMRLEAAEERLDEDDVPPVVMPLPRVDDESVRVNVNVASGRPRRTSSQLAQLPPAQADVARAEDAIFVAMEAAVTGLYDVVRASGGGPMARARKSAVQCCYVGEEVVIELVLRNPLRAELSLGELGLACKLSTEEGTVPPSLGYAVEARQIALPPQSAGEYRDTSTDIANLVDGPVELRVMPKAEGNLVIEGLRWKLMDELPCEHTFRLKGTRLNKTKRQRQSHTPQYSEDKRLQLRVCPPMPLLRVAFSEPAPSLLAGELRRITLKLTNIGRTADMESVTLAISHPAFCFVSDGKNDVTDAAPPPPGTQPATPDLESVTQSHSLVTLIAGGSAAPHDRLPPDGSAEFTLWLYGTAPGSHTLSFLFYYDATPAHSNINFRTLQHSMKLTVAPSLAVAATLSNPSGEGGEGGAPVVCLDLVNRAETPLVMQTLTCISSNWSPQQQGAGGAAPVADTLAAGQQSTLHLQLSSSPPPVADGDEPAPRSLLHSRLPLPGSEQPGPTLGSTAGGPTWQFVLRQQHEAAWLRNWLVEGEREYAPDVVQLGVMWCTAPAPSGGSPRAGYSFVTTALRQRSWVELPPRGLSEYASRGGGDEEEGAMSATPAGPGLKQHWQGRGLLMGGGEEGAKREAVLDEIEGTRAEKARRKAEELALMASKNQARRDRVHEGRAPVARAATKAPAELCPVQLSLEAVGTMVHDFATEQMCEVPVTVVLQNVSRLFAATVDLIAERAVGPDGEVGGCLWAGVTKQQLTLAPNERRTVELSAVFCEAGVFELEVISARVGWGSFASTLLPATSLVVLTPAEVAAPPLGDASLSSIDTSAM